MDREPKNKKLRGSSNKEHRANSRGKPRLQSDSSEPKSIHQIIKQNDQKIEIMNSQRNFIVKELEQAKNSYEQSQFKEKIISERKKQIQMIEEGLVAAEINKSKLIIMWMAELNISNVVPEFQQQIKKKTEKKKQNIGSKMREFANEDQEQE